METRLKSFVMVIAYSRPSPKLSSISVKSQWFVFGVVRISGG